MKMLNLKFHYIIVLLAAFVLMLSLPACSKHTCPANNGGYVDKVKPRKHYKAQTGLWSKNMRRKG